MGGKSSRESSRRTSKEEEDAPIGVLPDPIQNEGEVNVLFTEKGIVLGKLAWFEIGEIYENHQDEFQKIMIKACELDVRIFKCFFTAI